MRSDELSSMRSPDYVQGISIPLLSTKWKYQTNQLYGIKGRSNCTHGIRDLVNTDKDTLVAEETSRIMGNLSWFGGFGHSCKVLWFPGHHICTLTASSSNVSNHFSATYPGYWIIWLAQNRTAKAPCRGGRNKISITFSPSSYTNEITAQKIQISKSCLFIALTTPSKMLRRIALSLLSTSCHNFTRHAVSLKPRIAVKSFHISRSYRSRCDLGRFPCNCYKCKQGV
jgi:hypothetical protein